MKPKKSYPPGTFIPTPARIFAILQLCIAFSILLWHASQPFMGDLYRVKSKLLIFQHVQSHPLYPSLAQEQQQQIQDEQVVWQAHLSTPFFTKLGQSFAAVAFGIPPLELIWIGFSVIISVLLLKKVEGASEALWLLPLLAGAYAVENQLRPSPPLTAEERLFPSEALLVDTYLKEPFSRNIFDQQAQLKKGWEAYLVQEWTDHRGTPDEGFFYFNLARLKVLEKRVQLPPQERESLLALALYLFWNFSYAYYVGNKITSLKLRDLQQH